MGKIAALPLDVREVFDLPAAMLTGVLGLRPNESGRSPVGKWYRPTGKAQPFRTSSGKAASNNKRLNPPSLIFPVSPRLPAAFQKWRIRAWRLRRGPAVDRLGRAGN